MEPGNPPQAGVIIEFDATGSAIFPYAARVGGKRWVVRVNDFPAEVLYTLFIDGAAAVHFDDWPRRWRRPVGDAPLMNQLKYFFWVRGLPDVL